MKNISLVIFLILHLGCLGQTRDIEIMGNLSTTEGEKLSAIPITLWENQDSLTSTISAWDGNFTIHSSFTIGKEYILTFDYKYQSETDIVIQSKLDTSIFATSYSINVELIKTKIARDPEEGIIYFEKNQLKAINKTKIEFISALLNEFPTACLEFYYAGSNTEKKEFGEKRIGELKAILEENSIDLSKCLFRDEGSKVRAYNKDQRARFWISVASSNGCE